MGKPVNLNRFKKNKARAENKARADQNAITHGLTKAEKEATKTQNALNVRRLDGLKSDAKKRD